MRYRMWFAGVIAACMTSAATALDVTIDLNGFPAVAGLQVNGTGFEQPQRFNEPPPHVVIKGVQPGGRYNVDFFHNSGPLGSDFSFTIDAEGKGVATVSKGGEVNDMVDAFRPGATTLKMRTFPIVFNADGAQTGAYFISGLLKAHSLKADSGPQRFTAVPGIYSVDNLYNTNSGKEDFRFVVKNDGTVGPAEGFEGFAAYKGNEVHVRAVTVQWTIASPYGPINYHTSHASEREQPERSGDQYSYKFTVSMTVGGGGVNVWSFGPATIDKTNLINHLDESVAGTKSANDAQINPRIIYDDEHGFRFLTTAGPSEEIFAEVSGFRDDGETPLAVRVTAKILQPKEVEQEKPTTQPAN